MNYSKHTIKRTMLATAVTTALGATAYSTAVTALDLTFSVTGTFTMINSTGLGALNNTDSVGAPYYGFRTPVEGTMTFDTDTKIGSMSLNPFSFFGGGSAAATSITFGPGETSTELLTNMGFDWNGNLGIPVSLTWEAKGLLDALDKGMTVGDTIGPGSMGDFECAGTGAGTDIDCALPATDDFVFDFGKSGTYVLPIGSVPLATTTFNTTTIGGVACTLGCNPSGTLPLIADPVGGNPMAAGPFPGFNANFDFESMTLDSDGTGAITAPLNIPDDSAAPPAPDPFLVPETPGPTKDIIVELGHPSDLLPGSAVAEYCEEDLAATCDMNDSWIPDSTTNLNPITIEITQQTVTTKNIPWRSAVSGDGLAFDTQVVTATIDDTIAPEIDTEPTDIAPDVDSTPTEICFTDDGSGAIGSLTGTDVWDADPAIEWSLDGFFPGNENDPDGNCTSEFGPGENTVYWRITDESGNFSSREQSVELVLPDGIVGTDCVIDLDTIGDRAVTGRFIMRNGSGSLIGEVDNTVTGRIDTDPAMICTDDMTGACTFDSAAWDTTQTFFGSLWFATPVRLYGENVPEPSWTFETCLDDGSNRCEFPQPLSMTSVAAAPDQLAAHMLFEWNGNLSIDVVTVWDVDCGEFMLTATDPDGDGVIGTRMVDGPFGGFNAAFDFTTASGEPPIAEGGFTATVPTFQNPIDGGSPPLLDFNELDPDTLPDGSGGQKPCVGGCFDFRVTDPNLMEATDAAGTYKFTRVAFPLDEGMPFWSLVQKVNGTDWENWVIDSRNLIKTAPINDDLISCPEPGSGDYSVPPTSTQLDNVLVEDHRCLEVTIEDNGPNDEDSDEGEIDDPLGVAQVPAPPAPKAATSGSSGGTGGCSLSNVAIDPAKRADWTLMGGLMAVLGMFSLYRRRKQKH